MAFKHIFSPVTLRHKTLRNRIVFGAHTSNMSVNGLPGEQHAAYYGERAIGGAAMIVVEPMPVHAAAVLTRGNFLHSNDAIIPHFRKVTEAIRQEGAVAIQQLYHVGQHGDADNSFHANWSPSGLPSYHDSDGSHTMNEREIEETINGFCEAARRCYEAGFDGVEVWAAYHSILDQFWTPWSNRRDDKWGGNLENRTRMSREIISRIRRTCGEDFIIGLSVSDEPDVDIMLSREALAEIVALHDQTQMIDYVTCGVGGYFDFYKLMPTFLYPDKMGTDLSHVLKGTVSHALVTAEAHIRTPENAETVLGEGLSDLISLVRGQIADPFLVNKAREGRPEDIRGCLSCNQMCWGRRSRDYWISCVVNPSVGREWQWGGDRFSISEKPKKVLVVGGGPAGLEAARVSGECGHRVVLAEAGPRLGGAFALAGRQPRRAQITDLINWYERQLVKLQVEMRLNTYMESADVIAVNADEIILATGSQSPDTGFQKALPHLGKLPGLKNGNVHSAEAIMAGQARPGKRVIVLDEGGNWKGCGTAWKLAEDGHEVTIVTADALIGKELQRSAADFPLRRNLTRLGARFIVESAICEWTAKGARVVSLLSGDTRMIEADTLVMATANMAYDKLARELEACGVNFKAIGDGVAARQAPYAIYDGRRTAMEI
ncbi:MAG: FAD-dependent oxidoreductase [Proteobacteria bacterium]|nr:FAD-dependent oxidoreductase [Pseudomonadota bacterium]